VTLRSRVDGDALAASVVAVALSAAFVILVLPLLAVIPYDYDESWLMLDARFIARGEHPFADFAHHEMPLQLYLLALFGKLFGPTVFGYRMVSLTSVAVSGVLVFALARPFAGPVAALIVEAVFLFSPLQSRALTGIPESPMVAATLLGTWLLFVPRGRWPAVASGLVFVGALMIKPTCLPMVLAAALSLACGREWRRLGMFTVAGIVGAVAALVWTLYISDGYFTEVLLLQLRHVGTRRVGMWSIESGFHDMRVLAHIDTPWQLAMAGFTDFFDARRSSLALGGFVLSLLAIPIWVVGCARSRPALAAFVVLWPASWLFLDFVGLDFVSPRYFLPYPAFAAVLLAGWFRLVQRWMPAPVVAGLGVIVTLVLASNLRPLLSENIDLWYWGRVEWIGREVQNPVAFSPMIFAATGAEPGCGFANPALTYGALGEPFLTTEHSRKFLFSDERLVACLRAHPETPIVIDWAFYFFTRHGSPLREYLAGEGSGQRLFFSEDAVAQWDRPLLQMSPNR
jgi:4-amino-4-deoxy-L-arabinose transferase-like glycosyltransferase